MPASNEARTQTVNVPFSEAAMHVGVAGLRLAAVEEDQYVNGKSVPKDQRTGCYLLVARRGGGVVRVPMLKAEAGWQD